MCRPSLRPRRRPPVCPLILPDIARPPPPPRRPPRRWCGGDGPRFILNPGTVRWRAVAVWHMWVGGTLCFSVIPAFLSRVFHERASFTQSLGGFLLRSLHANAKSTISDITRDLPLTRQTPADVELYLNSCHVYYVTISLNPLSLELQRSHRRSCAARIHIPQRAVRHACFL